MEGITVLNKVIIDVMERHWEWNWLICIFIFAVLIGLLVVIIALIDSSHGGSGFEGLAGILMIIIFGYLTLNGGLKEVKVGEDVQYNVLISDEVSFNEVYDKFEVISKEGVIYTVRVRDGSELVMEDGIK